MRTRKRKARGSPATGSWQPSSVWSCAGKIQERHAHGRIASAARLRQPVVPEIWQTIPR